MNKRKWQSDRSRRKALRSPGRPSPAMAPKPSATPQLRHSLTWDQGAEMAHTHICGSTPGSMSTSATLTAHGSAARTR